MDIQGKAKITILIVDDQYDFNEEISDYLGQLGYTTINAYAAEEFKQKANTADIVILDIRIPKQDGAQIDPWGGLIALSELQRPDHPSDVPKYHNRIIIRSVNKEVDKPVDISVDYSAWLNNYDPLHKIITAITDILAHNLE